MGNAFLSGFGNVGRMAAIMLHSGAKVPALDAVTGKGTSLVAGFEHENLGAGRSQGRLVVIKRTIKLGLSG